MGVTHTDPEVAAEYERLLGCVVNEEWWTERRKALALAKAEAWVEQQRCSEWMRGQQDRLFAGELDDDGLAEWDRVADREKVLVDRVLALWQALGWNLSYEERMARAARLTDERRRAQLTVVE